MIDARVRIAAIVGVIAVIAVAVMMLSPRAKAPTTIAGADSFELALSREINAARRAHGVPPLRRSLPLAKAASAKAVHMARLGYFAHVTPQGTSPIRLIRRYYVSRGFRAWSAGENLGWATVDVQPATIVQWWLNSPAHRKNLLARQYREMGVGAVRLMNGTGFWAGRGDVVVIAFQLGVRRR